MREFEIEGVKYPFEIDTEGWEDWEEHCNKSCLDFDPSRIKESFRCLYHGLVRGGEIKAQKFPFTYEEMRSKTRGLKPVDLFNKIVEISGVFEELEEPKEPSEKK